MIRIWLVDLGLFLSSLGGLWLTPLLFLFGQGVALAVTSLVMTLAQDNLEAYAICYQKAVDRLNKVGLASFTADGTGLIEVETFRSSSRRTTPPITFITKFLFPGSKLNYFVYFSTTHPLVRSHLLSPSTGKRTKSDFRHLQRTRLSVLHSTTSSVESSVTRKKCTRTPNTTMLRTRSSSKPSTSPFTSTPSRA